MSSWITNGLKTLRIRVGGAVGSVTQQRSPQQYGAQMKEVEIPPRPKKPLTPYFRYLGQVRDEVQRQNPSLKPTEVIRMVGQKWEGLDDSTKQSYQNAYKNELVSYSSILEKYKKSLTPEQIQLQQQLKLEKQLQKERREKRKRLKELGKPRKPPTPFFLYLANNIPRGSKIDDYQGAAKKLGVEWKSMSEAEKAPYIRKYEDENEIYKKALKKWEEKMLKEGNEELIPEARRSVTARAKSKAKAAAAAK